MLTIKTVEVSLQKKFKFSVKNFISDNLSIFNRIKLFKEYYSSVSRLNLYKKNTVKIEKNSELFKKNPEILRIWKI